MAIDPTAEVHPTAVVEPGAEIGAGCRIGPYCVIGPEVVLGPRRRAAQPRRGRRRAPASARTRVIFPFASIGHIPQDLKFRGERVELVIGARNRIREHVTMNPGTEGGGGVTRVGDDNLFMMATHVAHDCIIGNHVIMANNATLGGHCRRRGLRDPRRPRGGAPVRAPRPRRDDRRPGRRRRRRHPLRLGDRRAGAPRRAEPRRAEARAGPGATTSTACAPPSPRCSRARATCRSGCARAGEQHAGNPLVQEVVDFVTAESARSFTVPGGLTPRAGGRARHRRRARRPAAADRRGLRPARRGPTGWWSSTAWRSTGSAGHPVIRAAFEKPGRLFADLRAAGCGEVTFAGGMARPRLRPLALRPHDAAAGAAGAPRPARRRRRHAAHGRRHLRGRGLRGARAARDPGRPRRAGRACSTRAAPGDGRPRATPRAPPRIVAALGAADVGQGGGGGRRHLPRARVDPGHRRACSTSSPAPPAAVRPAGRARRALQGAEARPGPAHRPAGDRPRHGRGRRRRRPRRRRGRGRRRDDPRTSPATVAAADAAGLFLWAREAGNEPPRRRGPVGRHPRPARSCATCRWRLGRGEVLGRDRRERVGQVDDRARGDAAPAARRGGDRAGRLRRRATSCRAPRRRCAGSAAATSA